MDHPQFVRTVEQLLVDVSQAVKAGQLTALAIGNSARVLPPAYAVTPLRLGPGYVAGSLLVSTLEQAQAAAALADGRVNCIFVDVDVKHSSLLGVRRALQQVVRQSKLISFKGTDATVTAADELAALLLGPLFGVKAVVAGAGSIGTKLALRLAERGASVTIMKRNLAHAQQLADALTLILPKSGGRLDGCPLSSPVSGAKLLVGATTGVPVITREMVECMDSPALVLDVGIGTVTEEALETCLDRGIQVLRVDVRAGFAAAVTGAFHSLAMVEKDIGAGEWDGVRVVAGGTYGRRGYIVVDSITYPTRVLGVCDGYGGLLDPESAEQFQLLLDKAGKWIAEHTNGLVASHKDPRGNGN